MRESAVKSQPFIHPPCNQSSTSGNIFLQILSALQSLESQKIHQPAILSLCILTTIHHLHSGIPKWGLEGAVSPTDVANFVVGARMSQNTVFSTKNTKTKTAMMQIFAGSPATLVSRVIKKLIKLLNLSQSVPQTYPTLLPAHQHILIPHLLLKNTYLPGGKSRKTYGTVATVYY